MNAPPRWYCEERRFVDNCPLTYCREYVPGRDEPLRRKPVCGRTLGDVAELYGGLMQTEIAWYLGIDPKGVRIAEASGLEKMKRRLKVLEAA